MLEIFRTAIAKQYEAALYTLDLCIDNCPDATWNARVGNNPFCQVAFHALFFADYYLGENADAFRLQPFHAANPEIFRDYEQLEDREPVELYERGAVQRYLGHCRAKAATTIASETVESLAAKAGFTRRNHSRAELHLCNIRHLQHHAAQLSLRLRIDAGVGIAWCGSGWRDDASLSS